MELGWIRHTDEEHAKSVFAKYNKDFSFPDEKKHYLIDLKESFGPYLAAETGSTRRDLLMDAASQIASFGVGFNCRSFFGVAHHPETWTNEKSTFNHKAVRKAFHDLLAKKLTWPEMHMKICNSGAESNETALGACYLRRVNPKAKKVLAFEGSFHGRMMVSLWSSWSPAKRVPFQWPGFETFFAPFPESRDGQIEVPVTAAWRGLWGNAPAANFLELLENEFPKPWDALLEREIKSLLVVREQLLTNEYYATIVEPMQCEGGDAYSTSRFHNALANMTNAFRVPVIYDEVQTGFHLGRDFFWHKLFDLRNALGDVLYPDYLVTAKKAQVGLVLAHEPWKGWDEEYSSASLHRGFVHASVLDQYHDKILELEKKVAAKLKTLIAEYPETICDARTCGMAFAFRFKKADHLNPFIALRFGEGIMCYPAGSDTARFRMSLAYGEKEITLLFERLWNMLAKLTGLKTPKAIPEPAPGEHTKGDYERHLNMVGWQIQSLGKAHKASSNADLKNAMRDYLVSQFPDSKKHLTVDIIDKGSFAKYKQAIIDLEKRVYEPARVTPIEKFESCLVAQNGLAIAILEDSKLVGMICGGPIKGQSKERGVLMDPFYDQPGVYYMLATTVDEEHRGSRLGELLKYCFSWIALDHGIERIEGRNRDRLAKAMLAVNYSLGAVDLYRLRDEYLDENPHRDTVYYTIPLRWTKPRLNLSNGVSAPLGIQSLDKSYCEQTLPSLINKLTISNFVDHPYLQSLRKVIDLLPKDLQHVYTTSGQSECVDKLAKSVWFTRKTAPKMLTFEGCYYGNGSFLARTLSGHPSAYFSATHLPVPITDNWRQVAQMVEEKLKTDSFHMVWIEPIYQKSLHQVPFEFLKELRSLCKRYGVPLAYNETASQAYRYSDKAFFASGIDEIKPDGGFFFVGNQMGVVYTCEQYFVKEPLSLISTWDGDAYSLHAYVKGNQVAIERTAEFKALTQKFTAKLEEQLQSYGVRDYALANGCGWVSKTAPIAITQYLEYDENSRRYRVCPSAEAMTRYLAEVEL